MEFVTLRTTWSMGSPGFHRSTSSRSMLRYGEERTTKASDLERECYPSSRSDVSPIYLVRTSQVVNTPPSGANSTV